MFFRWSTRKDMVKKLTHLHNPKINMSKENISVSKKIQSLIRERKASEIKIELKRN